MVSVWDGIDKNVKFFTSSEGGLQGGMIPTSQKAEEKTQAVYLSTVKFFPTVTQTKKNWSKEEWF